MKIRPFQLGLAAVSALALAAVTACSSGTAASPTPGGAASANTNPVSVLIGSSGEAETTAVTAAVAAWSKQSGIPGEVKVASNLTQQATQGFAGGKPDDVLYVSTDALAGWAANKSLEAYGDQLSNKSDFYPKLVEAFTVDGTFYCAPKDFSTLALVINTKLWKDAGLTDNDVPKTWADLETVAKKLTKGKVKGLVLSHEVQRLGVFMAQNGGGLVTDGAATANSTQNVEALAFVKKMLNEGGAAFNTDIGAGWGGEALGKNQAAMVVEGNWITGAKKDYPNLDYTVAALPAGTQQGTLQFTNCWGIAADADNKEAAKSLVEFLTTTDQQLAFAKAFGVMPSVQSATEGYKEANPTMVPFIDGAAYAQNLPAQRDVSEVLTELNSKLAKLKDGDPQAILEATQGDLQAVVG
ncbi:MAG: extracellular solute-binding protein [Micropruina sp.]|nr:extracellular solute-binding protein [Micropruina sp.]